MTTLEAWRSQLEEAAADYLPVAIKRRRPMKLVLRVDEQGNVLPAKMAQEIEPSQRLERVIALPAVAEGSGTVA